MSDNVKKVYFSLNIICNSLFQSLDTSVISIPYFITRQMIRYFLPFLLYINRTDLACGL